MNGNIRNHAEVTYGVPRGSVFGPLVLLLFFTLDLLNQIAFGSTYLYADGTTMYCTARTLDPVVYQLNRVLSELYQWSLATAHTIHTKKSEVMPIHKQACISS